MCVSTVNQTLKRPILCFRHFSLFIEIYCKTSQDTYCLTFLNILVVAFFLAPAVRDPRLNRGHCWFIVGILTIQPPVTETFHLIKHFSLLHLESDFHNFQKQFLFFITHSQGWDLSSEMCCYTHWAHYWFVYRSALAPLHCLKVERSWTGRPTERSIVEQHEKHASAYPESSLDTVVMTRWETGYVNSVGANSLEALISVLLFSVAERFGDLLTLIRTLSASLVFCRSVLNMRSNPRFRCQLHFNRLSWLNVGKMIVKPTKLDFMILDGFVVCADNKN